jgi:hypothetical protein
MAAPPSSHVHRRQASRDGRLAVPRATIGALGICPQDEGPTEWFSLARLRDLNVAQGNRHSRFRGTWPAICTGCANLAARARARYARLIPGPVALALILALCRHRRAARTLTLIVAPLHTGARGG